MQNYSFSFFGRAVQYALKFGEENNMKYTLLSVLRMVYAEYR